MINEDPTVLGAIIEKCNEKFDGDRNVLMKDLLNSPLNKSTTNSFAQMFEEHLHSRTKCTNLKDKTYLSMLAQDSLCQIYSYFGTNASDSISIKGIVVIPEGIKQRSGVLLRVINIDGSESSIAESPSFDPEDNYLIISKNERLGKKLMGETFTGIKNSDKAMRITRAKFTSIEAKRTVESWWAGEPEVRLNMVYAERDPSTNQLTILRNTTFMYPKKWLKVKTFGTNKVVWNNAAIDFPHWYLATQSHDRRLIWTEEDGSTKEQEISQVVTDPITGIKTTIKTMVPASTDDTLIADSYIYFSSPNSSTTLEWGIIKFDISF